MSLSAVARATQHGGVQTGTQSVPAPYLGWNTKLPIDNMPQGFAPVLDNFVIEENGVQTRAGYIDRVGGLGGPVETIMEFRAGTSTKLIAAANGKIYDGTSSPAVELGTGFSNNRWQGTMFEGRLFLCNGEDAPQVYDGATLAAITGVTGPADFTKMVDVKSFKKRLFYVEKDTANFWYGGIQAITGPITKFDLSSVQPEGGNLTTIGRLTIDSGQGIDDLAVFYLDSGVFLVYAGTDPGRAQTWSQLGAFPHGAPLGRRCFVAYGADVIALSVDAYDSINAFIRTGLLSESTISDAIGPTVKTLAKSARENFGWQGVVYPLGRFILFNVPVAPGQRYDQHVYNYMTKGWSRFVNIPAVCWAVVGERLFFGTPGGNVCEFDATASDNGAEIRALGQTAWEYHGGSVQKLYKMLRPMIDAPDGFSVAVDIGVDFTFSQPKGIGSPAASSGAIWDVDNWDVGEWAGGLAINKDWKSTDKMGFSGSVVTEMVTAEQQCRWYRTDIVYETGGIL